LLQASVGKYTHSGDFCNGILIQMEFGATADIYSSFNLYEALFWWWLGASLLGCRHWAGSQYQSWLLFSAANILLFGVTDVVELYTGGFLHTATWLLYWKVGHVLGLGVSVAWYVRLRLKQR